MKIFSYSASFKKWFTLLFAGLASGVQAQDLQKSVAHIGLVYPLSSNGTHADRYSNSFSLHLLAGVSGAETGFSMAGLGSVVRQDAKGLMVSGLFNTIGGRAQGAQLSGLLNRAQSARATQLAGLLNVVSHETQGVQLAGVTNVAGTGKAVQVAGVGNVSRQSAVQVAGVFNQSEEVHTQVAGLINVAKRVKGVQIGVLNIADSSDYSIGLINLVKNGEKRISLSTDETLTGFLSFRSGGRVLYGLVGLGYNLKQPQQSLYGLEAGLGAHVLVREPYRVSLEAVTVTLTDFKKREYLRNSLRILPSVRFAKQWEFFLGPTINYVDFTRETSDDLRGIYLWSKQGTKHTQGLYLGVTAGLQIIL
ncbi:hypothetical protein BWI97_24325 [Siphonobacter sp. BAB-5405]|uniref:hypothetical protein n=1 Tax=Siphonobacter sp. BAB-5405 TaxID=1864825 RepID=UPI000C80B7AC|nr:hypothetical protein [Siphonobacter sp. BAB-5405]PMD90041.1 hypothetical protein BWI97_24325 [Siphonobacter sp. BAB-5405]